MISVNLFGRTSKELERFLSSFYNTSVELNNELSWKHKYKNPIEITDIIGAFIDNSDKFHISMWICLDNNIYINITEKNADYIIKYLYERFPY